MQPTKLLSTFCETNERLKAFKASADEKINKVAQSTTLNTVYEMISSIWSEAAKNQLTPSQIRALDEIVTELETIMKQLGKV
jgi:vacuolar-type H+-ATPase subunit I/STV1